MAYANALLIDALRRTATRLTEGSSYAWGHLGACNCGQLAQAITGRSGADIHRVAMRAGGAWIDRAREYCPTSGRPVDEVISELLAVGLNTSDLADLENLGNDEVLRALPSGRRWLERNRREDVVEYLETWADLLESQLGAREDGARAELRLDFAEAAQ